MRLFISFVLIIFVMPSNLTIIVVIQISSDWIYARKLIAGIAIVPIALIPVAIALVPIPLVRVAIALVPITLVPVAIALVPISSIGVSVIVVCGIGTGTGIGSKSLHLALHITQFT